MSEKFADLVNGLQRTWEESLAGRAVISPRSAVSLLEGLLAAHSSQGSLPVSSLKRR